MSHFTRRSTSAIGPRRPTAPALRRPRLTAASVAALVVASLTLLAPTAANAHVRASSDDAAQGGYGLITLRVPTESDTARTTELTVTVPKNVTLTSASTEPVDGWSSKVTTEKLDEPVTIDGSEVDSRVSTITWKADSEEDGLKPSEFGRFSLLAGPLPETDTLVLPTKQTYSDGSSVDWSQVATGDAEPEHPAPEIVLAAAGGSDAHGAAASAPAPAAAENTSEDISPADTTAIVWGVIGAIAGLLALVVAIVTAVRVRRR